MVDIKVDVFLTKRWWVFNCPPWLWDWRLLLSPHINEKYMDINCTILGPAQTPLHTCTEPNWWIKYGKRGASESIWYGSFNLLRQKRQTRRSLSHYSTSERQVIHTALLRGRPFNSWGWGWVISGHQEFFFLALWWTGYFFPFFPHKLSITFVLHAIFFFRQALAGNFFSKSLNPPPPPSRVKWLAPYINFIFFPTILLVFTQLRCAEHEVERSGG